VDRPTPSPLLPFIDARPSRISVDVALPAESGTPLASIEGLLAGAAEVDITPPPGMPKAGHSRNAQDGIGFRTRLRARVIHLRAGSASVAIVAGDMHAGSAVVHRLVAQAVASSTDVPASGLLLGSTHTHAGPGQFHGCDFYNRFASNRPGFDPAYTHFVSERIASAVERACETRRPARLATGSTEVWGFTRNRSLSAHVCNETVEDKRLEPHRKYAAINPLLHLVRVDASAADGGFEPLAALVVFSIHGTGISRHDPAYNADVWAYITGEIESRIERSTGTRAVVGAIEGTHGDMTPAVRPGMLVYPEAERVGRGIGEAAAALHSDLEGQLRADVRLASAMQEIDLGAKPEVAGITLPGPAVGAAKLAGAIENSTPILDRLPPFKAGYPKPGALSNGAHGVKWVIGSRAIQRYVTPTATFPSILPIQLVVVGSTAMLALPFEITVEAGRRLESATIEVLRRAAGVEEVVVSSAANDYWDYLTTPEEYSRQCYEGASTLYGPRSLDFVGAAAARLAARLEGSDDVGELLPLRRFEFHARRYLPGRSGARVARTSAARPAFTEATPTEDGFWQFEWFDVAPGDLAWHEPLARVEALAGQGSSWVAARDLDGALVDDQGWRVGVVHLGADRSSGSRHRYAARWYEPTLGAPRPHRFVICANAGQAELASEAFS
jgi:neutral ceramidase